MFNQTVVLQVCLISGNNKHDVPLIKGNAQELINSKEESRKACSLCIAKYQIEILKEDKSSNTRIHVEWVGNIERHALHLI